MPTCPNLKTLAGDRYRVTWEAPLDQRPTPGTKADPWLAMIPTKTGHLFPWDADTLGVWVGGRRAGLVRQLVEAGATIRTKGTDGTTLLLPVAAFEQAAQITGARKRRKLSPEHRAKLVAAGRPFPKRHESKSQQTGPVCPQSGLVDLEHVQGEQARAA